MFIPLGALDGTHIKITPLKKDNISYMNRKSYNSIILQAVVDHKQKFLDVFIGFPEAAHDERVFKHLCLEICINCVEVSL